MLWMGGREWKYTIADEKVLGKIVKIRCKKCGATIVINGNESGAGSQPNTAAAAAQAFGQEDDITVLTLTFAPALKPAEVQLA